LETVVSWGLLLVVAYKNYCDGIDALR